MKVKQGMSVIWLILKIPVWITIPIESSRRDLFFDMAVDRFVLKNNQITLSPCFTLIPKTGVGLLKSRVSFYWETIFMVMLTIKMRRICFTLYNFLRRKEGVHWAKDAVIRWLHNRLQLHSPPLPTLHITTCSHIALLLLTQKFT